MKNAGIFHPDFINEPYWWRAFRPGAVAGDDPPASCDVAIVGGGYTGLAMALELRRQGRTVAVLEAGELGQGASTRNGGGVSGGVNVGKSLSGRKIHYEPEMQRAILGDAAQAYSYIERFIAEEGIDCHWKRTGRFIGAWTPAHYEAQARTVESLNSGAASGSYMVPRERLREEIANDLYYGGQVVERSAFLHPALLYQGVLRACLREGATVCAQAAVRQMRRDGQGWVVDTAKGPVRAKQVAIATNGYTGDLTPQFKRRVIPIASHIIVTEPLPSGLAERILPTNRMINDTLRIRSYYRLTPDGTRVLFGGRGKFGQADVRGNSEVLYRAMLQRLPDLAGIRIEHAWSGNVAFTFDGIAHMGERDGLYYAMGCNGSGVALLSYLGYQTARKMVQADGYACAFDRAMPGNPLYRGNPWFLSSIGPWFRLRDRIDRALARD